MDYLFFDIECANCFNGNGKICSFGYVLADDRLRIKEQRDIIVNPRQKFHLHNRNGGGDIELAYTLDQFKKAPPFPEFYREISEMLTKPDRIVFGHSVNNDIGFLMSECRRYQLPYFDFKAYDTQIIHKLMTKAANDCGLSKICEAFGIDVSADLHRSDYDAYLTRSVLEKLCQLQNLSPDGLLELYPNAYFSAEQGKIVNHNATISYGKRLMEAAKRFHPIDKSKTYPEVTGKYFCFSKPFECDKFKEALYLVKRIRNLGGFYASKIGHSDYFLQFGENCARAEQLPALRAEGIAPQVLDEDRLLEMLSIDRKEYDACPLMSFTALRGGRKRGGKSKRAESAPSAERQSRQAQSGERVGGSL